MEEHTPRNEAVKNLLEIRRDSNILYSDLTGSIATKLVKVINENLDNLEKVKILTAIIRNKGFIDELKNAQKQTITKIFGTIKETDVEYNDNLNAAKALNNLGYDVYMLPRIIGNASPDFIIKYGKMLYIAELKTIYGKNSLENRLNAGVLQADRIILNIVGDVDSRYVGKTIKDFYLKNQQIKDIKVLLGGKPIDVKYKHVKEKKFIESFMSRWAR